MSADKWDGDNHYFSGQGVVLVGKRDALGKPAQLRPIGNVPDLKIAVSTSTIEHKESQTGQRGIDFRLVTETKASLTANLENFISTSLADAFRGDHEEQLAGTVANEALKLYNGCVVSLAYLQVDSFVLSRGAQALTKYTNDATAWDYKLNPDAGSVMFNDGQGGQLVDKLTTGGTAPSAITVGNPTVITVANTAAVGDYVVFTGFAGADAALINGKAFRITVASSTSVSIALDTTGKTITLGTPLSAFDGISLDADYNYAGQNLVNALTQGQQERWLRFEGLNTADENKPVVIDVFRFVVDPAKELSLISDNLQNFQLEGSVLKDAFQTTGSQFFRVRMLR